MRLKSNLRILSCSVIPSIDRSNGPSVDLSFSRSHTLDSSSRRHRQMYPELRPVLQRRYSAQLCQRLSNLIRIHPALLEDQLSVFPR